MKNGMHLETLVTASGRAPEHQLTLFALLNLGMIESLGNGLISATDALRLFFNAENCLFVRKNLREKIADKIMSHGVHCRTYSMRSKPRKPSGSFGANLQLCALCLKFLEGKRSVA